MSDQNPEQEPSMEEILASIRRIISEDGEEDQATDGGAEDAGADAEAEVALAEEPAAEAEPEPEPEPEPEIEAEPEPEPEAPEPEEPAEEEDVLELTEEVQDDGTVVDLNTGEALEETPEEEPEPAEEMAVEEPAEEPVALEEPVVEEAAAALVDERLVSQMPATDSVSTLASLAAAVDGHRRATDPSIGPKTIEELVKEVMRPMIRDWLDANLPSLVERLVGREIERLTRHAEDITER